MKADETCKPKNLTITHCSGVTEYSGSAGYVSRAWRAGRVLLWVFGCYYNQTVSATSTIELEFINKNQTNFGNMVVSHAQRFPSSILNVECYYAYSTNTAERNGLILLMRTTGYVKNTLINDSTVLISSSTN